MQIERTSAKNQHSTMETLYHRFQIHPGTTLCMICRSQDSIHLGANIELSS